eukprot:TRINITY_DN5806_c0_g2_i5.p1 TRINITY_DN5806_c0_g2~~TRINITY_DN5806_c0_g2_i5.p1  ORF type:complete len:202 (+),score=49.11 TRINITY_DN5806_c0_g2_i5:599-1204(+)
MFGRKAVELIRELDRTDDDQLLPYNVDVIEEALKEVAEHNSQLSKVLQKMRQERALGAAAGEAAGAADSAAILVHHRSILRNKRCIMAYLHHRMKKINALRWQLGGRLPEEIAGKLSQSEVEAYNAHCKCLADYMDAVLVDLNVDATPPKDPYIEVRVLEDLGSLTLGNKVVHMTANSLHLLKRVDAEPLILQGLLEHRQF